MMREPLVGFGVTDESSAICLLGSLSVWLQPDEPLGYWTRSDPDVTTGGKIAVRIRMIANCS